MRELSGAVLIALICALVSTSAQGQPKVAAIILPPTVAPGTAVRPYVKVDTRRLVLAHVRVIDGTGAPELADRAIVLEGGKILSIGASSDPVPTQSTVLDLSGHTVIPGIVGMHDHLYYI